MEKGKHSHDVERLHHPNEDYLLEVMKQRPVSAKEIQGILQIQGTTNQRCDQVWKFILYISRYLPVYETSPRMYKMLTEKDMDEYWESKRTTLEDLYAEYND